MKVWLVNHYAVPPSSTGITRHHDLAKHLSQRGVDVSIIASGFDHYSRTDRGNGQAYVTEMVDGIRYCWLATPAYGDGVKDRSRNMVAFATRLVRYYHRLDLPRPDVIVGSSPHLLTPLAAGRVAKKLDAGFVFEVRDIWPESLVELGGPPRWHPAIVMLDRIERYLYRNADRVVSVLPAAAEHIRRRVGRPVDVTWIPNGSQVPDDPPADAVDDGVFDIVYAGTIGHANALDVVIDAAELLENGKLDVGGVGGQQREIRWHIVGLGPERQHLERRAAELDLRTVVFEGPVPRTEIPRVLADADVCLLHLMDSPVFRWGVSPNKLFDYMRAARPVIFAVATPHDPVQIAGAGISIAPSDPHALARAAQSLSVTDPSVLHKMGADGFEYLRRNHDLAVLADRYLTVFEELLATR